MNPRSGQACTGHAHWPQFPQREARLLRPAPPAFHPLCVCVEGRHGFSSPPKPPVQPALLWGTVSSTATAPLGGGARGEGEGIKVFTKVLIDFITRGEAGGASWG